MVVGKYAKFYAFGLSGSIGGNGMEYTVKRVLIGGCILKFMIFTAAISINLTHGFVA